MSCWRTLYMMCHPALRIQKSVTVSKSSLLCHRNRYGLYHHLKRRIEQFFGILLNSNCYLFHLSRAPCLPTGCRLRTTRCPPRGPGRASTTASRSRTSTSTSSGTTWVFQHWLHCTVDLSLSLDLKEASLFLGRWWFRCLRAITRFLWSAWRFATYQVIKLA